jgi:uncharacterized protein (TIGR03118 family)
MHGAHKVRARWAGGAVAVGGAVALLLTAQPGSATSGAMAADRHGGPAITQTNLVADRSGTGAAIVDKNLVNAWGLSHGPDTPVWVSDNGADVATLYTGAVGKNPVSAVPLVVSTPGGAPTGQAFNDTAGFRVPGTNAPALFVFAGENGDLSAWNKSANPLTKAVSVGQVRGAVYKGLALVHSPFGPLVLATDFHHNRVDVYDRTFHRLDVGLLFRDRHLPRGYAPFGIAAVGDRVIVTYAEQDAARHDDAAGPGHGFVDVYTTYGAFVRRLVSRGDLNSPWGLTVAPASFGRLAGDLLVGNFGDGRIHAYDLRTGHERGTLRDAHGHAIVIDGLWGLLVGDASSGGTDAVWFSAGPDGEQHGLLGTLTAP